jgi:hypothetical protein
MRALAAVLLGMVSACRHAPPETEPRVPDCNCTSMNCCPGDVWDDDSGAQDQTRSGLIASLLPDDGGSEEPAEATPRDAMARSGHPPQPVAEFVVHCERADGPPGKPGEWRHPILRWTCHRRWSDGGIQPCEPLDSCI